MAGKQASKRCLQEKVLAAEHAALEAAAERDAALARAHAGQHQMVPGPARPDGADTVNAAQLEKIEQLQARKPPWTVLNGFGQPC